MSTAPIIHDPGLSPSEWEEVHAQVQLAFDGLAERVRSRCAAALVRSGAKASGRVWFLFSYREFNWTPDDSEAEDIVAGLLFSPEGSGIRIRADIGGSATGQTDYELPERIVPGNAAAVLAAARELAEELSRHDEVVVKAMSERRPPPNYRAGLV